MNQKMGLLGKKVSMTTVYDGAGICRSATVIYTPVCKVTAVRTEDKDGYTALQISYTDEPMKEKRVSKPLKGQFKDLAGVPRKVREFRVPADVISKYKVGDTIGNDIFEKGQYVDVRGNTIGKGFQGVMRRHHFGGFISTHGSHESFRGPGSIGQRTWPGRVVKGKKMAGHMGAKTRTILNLKVLEVNPKENYIMVSGAVPGASNGWVEVRQAVKA